MAIQQYEQYKDYAICEYPRLDRYICEYLKLISRSQLKTQQIFTLTINNKPAKLSQRVHNGDLLEFCWQPKIETSILAQDISLNILYEDDYVWVIDKPQGMIVHPGAGNFKDTLANALAFRLKECNSHIYDCLRPGIVHRLDMETSGVIICAKDPQTHAFLATQFKNRTVKKRYLAILNTTNIAPLRGIIRNYIDRSKRTRTLFVSGDDSSRGKLAVTGYRVLYSNSNYSLILFKPHTGRTHQLRVHAKNHLAPIVGDTQYNPSYQQKYSLMLHAWKLQITLPNQKEPTIFTSPAPTRFYKCLSLPAPSLTT